MLLCSFLVGYSAAGGSIATYNDVRGTPYSVVVDNSSSSILINGESSLFLSGSLHYARWTPAMWDSLLAEARVNGLTMIETYVFWNLHEPQRGEYDFSTGRRDLPLFLQRVAAAGLFVYLRIGPYVCAEWDYGGIPGWIGRVADMHFRTDTGPWKAETSRWNYTLWCADLVRSLDTGIPWTMCNGAAAPDTVRTFNGNDAVSGWLERKDGFGWRRPEPMIWTEDEMWFSAWPLDSQPGGGVAAARRHRGWRRYKDRGLGKPTDDCLATAAVQMVRFFARGGTLHNFYMWAGGNNFERTAAGDVQTAYADPAVLHPDGLRDEPYFTQIRALHRVLAALSGALSGSVPQVGRGVNCTAVSSRSSSGNNDSSSSAYNKSTDVSSSASSVVAFRYTNSTADVIFIENNDKTRNTAASATESSVSSSSSPLRPADPDMMTVRCWGQTYRLSSGAAAIAETRTGEVLWSSDSELDLAAEDGGGSSSGSGGAHLSRPRPWPQPQPRSRPYPSSERVYTPLPLRFQPREWSIRAEPMQVPVQVLMQARGRVGVADEGASASSAVTTTAGAGAATTAATIVRSAVPLEQLNLTQDLSGYLLYQSHFTLDAEGTVVATATAASAKTASEPATAAASVASSTQPLPRIRTLRLEIAGRTNNAYVIAIDGRVVATATNHTGIPPAPVQIAANLTLPLPPLTTAAAAAEHTLSVMSISLGQNTCVFDGICPKEAKGLTRAVLGGVDLLGWVQRVGLTYDAITSIGTGATGSRERRVPGGGRGNGSTSSASALAGTRMGSRASASAGVGAGSGSGAASFRPISSIVAATNRSMVWLKAAFDLPGEYLLPPPRPRLRTRAAASALTSAAQSPEEVQMPPKRVLVLDATGLGRGHAFINGFDIGMFWPHHHAVREATAGKAAASHAYEAAAFTTTRRGKQSNMHDKPATPPPQLSHTPAELIASTRWYFIPPDLLRASSNTLLLLEEEGAPRPDLMQLATVSLIPQQLAQQP